MDHMASEDTVETNTMAESALQPSPSPGEKGLFDLARELRDCIYEYALCDEDPVYLVQDRNNDKVYSRLRSQGGASLLRTCKQIHEEATPIFYNLNDFVVDDLQTSINKPKVNGAESTENQPASPSDPPDPFKFMGLPPEIRDMVCAHIVNVDSKIIVSPGSKGVVDEGVTSSFPAIWLANRLVSEEATAILYGRNHFVLSSMFALRDFLNSIPHAIRFLTHLTVAKWHHRDSIDRALLTAYMQMDSMRSITVGFCSRRTVSGIATSLEPLMRHLVKVNAGSRPVKEVLEGIRVGGGAFFGVAGFIDGEIRPGLQIICVHCRILKDVAQAEPELLTEIPICDSCRASLRPTKPDRHQRRQFGYGYENFVVQADVQEKLAKMLCPS